MIKQTVVVAVNVPAYATVTLEATTQEELDEWLQNVGRSWDSWDVTEEVLFTPDWDETGGLRVVEDETYDPIWPVYTIP